MSIASELLALARTADENAPLPRVARLHVPALEPHPTREGEFGVVILEDGSAGFFFVLLGDTLARLHADQAAGAATMHSPLALAEEVESRDGAARAVAFGAISAITAHVFARAGLRPPEARSSLGGLDFADGDHVGMVGLFPSLAARLRERGVRLTVIELRPEKVEQAPGFEVTLDASRLRECNKVLCTGSTLQNGTVESILGHCADAERVALIGPTVSCFPDPLFRRGVHVVGGTAVTDADALAARLDAGEKWGDAVRRYALDRTDYPGFAALAPRR